MQSDAQLVEAVLGGDRAPFAILVQRYERAVLGVALGIFRDHHAAQDVAQDAFATAFQRLGTLRRPGRFAPWILGIPRRKAIDHCHQRSKSLQERLPDLIGTAEVTVSLDGPPAAVRIEVRPREKNTVPATALPSENSVTGE